MARTSMALLIQDIRSMTYASTAEYSVGTANYWDDDQIERILDRHERDVWHLTLTPTPLWQPGGSVIWLTYYAGCPDDPVPNWESTSGGTATFVIRNASGSAMATSTYTPDYQAGLVTFGTDQKGSVYYLDGRKYDLYGAAADLLTAWATREKLSFDFTEDGQTFRRSQKVAALLSLAAQYEAQQWIESGEMVRSDVDTTPAGNWPTGAEHHARA